MSDSEENEEVAVQVNKSASKKLKRKQVLKEKKNGAGGPGTPAQKKKKKNNKNIEKAPSPKESEESVEDEVEESSGDDDAPEPKKNVPEDAVLDLGKNIWVRVNEFKGNIFVDIREYYIHKETGDLKPGKKGMSMTPKMWADLKKGIPLIEKKLASKTST